MHDFDTEFVRKWALASNRGYNILAGIEWEQFQLSSAISNGLIQVFSGYNYNLWNSSFFVSLTYQFASILTGKK